MLPYFLMFAFWALLAIEAERRLARDPRLPLFVAASLVVTILVGLRNEVGTDWQNYLDIYDNMSFVSLRDAMTIIDPGYALLNWLGVKLDVGIFLANLVCAAIFVGGFARLAWRQPNPALAMLVATPYLIIVVGMGYTRQAAAIGVLCVAIADASEKRLARIVLLIGLAALFHKTAILMLPIILAPVFLRNVLLGIIGAALFAVLFLFVLSSSGDSMISQYVTSNYDSQGAAVRISMNVLAAAIFILLRKRFALPYFQNVYWTLNATLALLSVVALLAASASSGVDRFSLYLIPIQAVVYSQLPYVLGKNGKPMPSVLFGVVFYSFCVQYVWLTYADNARNWLPYHNILW